MLELYIASIFVLGSFAFIILDRNLMGRPLTIMILAIFWPVWVPLIAFLFVARALTDENMDGMRH